VRYETKDEKVSIEEGMRKKPVGRREIVTGSEEMVTSSEEIVFGSTPKYFRE